MITVPLKDSASVVDTVQRTASGELTVQNEGQSATPRQPGLCSLLRIHPVDLGQPQIKLDRSETVFGRVGELDVTLDDRSVSRRHAAIERVGSLYIITDLGSTNGTFVNGERVDTQTLRCGDRVRLGDQIFKFLEADGIEAQYHSLMLDSVSRDPLTGAFNKRYFTEILDRLAGDAKSAEPLSLILLDVDHFKSVNDTHGHLVGDDVLKELVRRLTETLRSEEILARFGGEEFAILLPAASNAASTAERCRTAICMAPFETQIGQLAVTISLGVATRTPAFSSAELIGASDAALYQAKANGRNRVCFEESE